MCLSNKAQQRQDDNARFMTDYVERIVQDSGAKASVRYDKKTNIIRIEKYETTNDDGDDNE